jgi:Uma2 family endonuclease
MAPTRSRPDLPEYMTWEELEKLPEDIAGEVELWEGRVVWVPRGPREHQQYANQFWLHLRRLAQKHMRENPRQCWDVVTETNVFLDSAKSDFVTPDFLVVRCPDQDFQDIHAADVYLAGEVLSPSNTPRDVEDKKARYAAAKIPGTGKSGSAGNRGASRPSGPGYWRRATAGCLPE